MCGICGVFEYQTGRPVSYEQLKQMTDVLVHRGPDDEGFLLKSGIGLGMRRLSIIDLAGGHQPISNEEQNIFIVFNGEIYNYQVLQKQMVERGHKLRTLSDTEVIIHLYEEYGDDCVKHLDGMFAFALYDERPSSTGPRLLIGRDCLGKKPLYYVDKAGALIFGSEIKPVLQDPRVSRELDEEALHHYLSLMMIPAPLSIFEDVRKLPPGHLLTCDAAGVCVQRYWNYLEHVNSENISEQEALLEIRRLLFAAVEKRLIAEVPLGAFLSGGLDSTAVVAVMSRLKKEPVKTFSIGFEGPESHNELPFARAAARYCRTDHNEIFVKPNIIELLPELTHYADEPFAISSSIPTYLLAKAARQQVTVILTGDGGDEVFGGYPYYIYERWAATYRKISPALDKILLRFLSLFGGRKNSIGRMSQRASRLIANSRRGLGERRLGWASGLDELDKQKLYARPRRAGIYQTTGSFLQGLISGKHDRLPPEVQQNCLDILLWLPDEMLTKVDRMTMGASIEARCPLLDRNLVEYLAGLSFTRKVPGWRTANSKHLLRKAVSDLLPADLLQRRKQGFNVPLNSWFRNGAEKYLKSTLSPERIKRRQVFNPDEVQRLLGKHQAGMINASNPLYALLVFEVWAEERL
jgi:asparagine synthase (glutamine-hydrolysing)